MHQSVYFCHKIGFDFHGYYVIPGLGFKYHNVHDQIHSKTVLESGLDGEDSSFIKDMGEGKAPPSIIQNTVFQKTGKVISRAAIRYITNFHKRDILNDSDFTGLFPDKPTAALSSTEYMMIYCRSKGYNFQLLLYEPLIGSEPVTETYMNNEDQPKIQSILDFSKKELDSVKNNIDFGRVASGMDSHQKYMMGFAWLIPAEIHLLEAFPHVIMIDTTEKTNNEKRPLLTAGGKDSNGNCFIFLRCFMPNQQAWMFRWILSVVFPRLLPKHILSNIKIIISDGDPQE